MIVTKSRLTDTCINWAGSSVTAGDYYHPIAENLLYADSDYLKRKFLFPNAAKSSHGIYSNLVRLSRDVLANEPDVIVIDHANGLYSPECMESFIRRALTGNLSRKLILLEMPSWYGQDYTDNNLITTPTNEADMAIVNALATHYSLPIIQTWVWAKTVVPGTYDLDALFTDGVHPSSIVGAWLAGEIKTQLDLGFSSAGSALPDRLYASTDYDNTPIIIAGTGYTSKTGTWAENGTKVSSSEVGATITFSATCQSFGCDGNRLGTQEVDISIDGGAYASGAIYQHGSLISAGRAAHTITIKVTSGTVYIDEFWAI